MEWLEPCYNESQGSTVSRFFFICIAITEVIKIVYYTKDFVIILWTEVHCIAVPLYNETTLTSKQVPWIFIIFCQKGMVAAANIMVAKWLHVGVRKPTAKRSDEPWFEDEDQIKDNAVGER